jgi:hypothetical protein
VDEHVCLRETTTVGWSGRISPAILLSLLQPPKKILLNTVYDGNRGKTNQLRQQLQSERREILLDTGSTIGATFMNPTLSLILK